MCGFRPQRHQWQDTSRFIAHDGDSSFFTADEWRKKEDKLLNDAEFVLVTEGGLNFLLNHNFGHPKIEELNDFCASFGYWFDMGHSWSVGFYRLENYDGRQTKGEYVDKLRDIRWKRKAALVKQRAQNKCEDCGEKSGSLQAHHCWYTKGLEPWQYPLDAFRALCKNCHFTRGEIEFQFRAMMSRHPQTELLAMHKAIELLFYWYDRDALIRFLHAAGPDNDKFREAFDNLSNSKSEPGRMN